MHDVPGLMPNAHCGEPSVTENENVAVWLVDFTAGFAGDRDDRRDVSTLNV